MGAAGFSSTIERLCPFRREAAETEGMRTDYLDLVHQSDPQQSLHSSGIDVGLNG